MTNTVENIFKDSRYSMACTFIVNCMDTVEVFTDKAKMLRMWGQEEARVYFLNTREVIVNIM